MTDLFNWVDLKQPYLTSQLIPYIGNKRSLLPFLYQVLAGLAEGVDVPVFIDPFAGSGSVSRLAKVMGMAVRANDWEPYTEVLNACHIALDMRDLQGLFNDRGGIARVIEELNNDRGPFVPFISRFYAPADLDAADYRTERLFYTPENAVFIDRLRGRIDQWYPEKGPERTVLLAALVLQAAVRSNTSGVFKACHKGFGGHGADALGRIMTKMRLVSPCLVDSRASCTVHREEAAVFAAGQPADICYLDPPYNAHQYGSNYHLLNTLVLWDFPEVDNRLGPDGRLQEKAAIRKDWNTTRSPFCSRLSASDALQKLLEAVDARYILLSYNTEGIIPFEELHQILSERGRVEIKTRDYTTYRGGRQSISRKVSNMEFLLLCRTGEKAGRKTAEVRDFMVHQRLFMLLRESYVPERLAERFRITGGDVLLCPNLVLSSDRLYRFSGLPDFSTLEGIPAPRAEALCVLLNEAACRDREEECRVLLCLLAEELSPGERKGYRDRLLLVLRKFAHRKYRVPFRRIVSDIRSLIEDRPERYGVLEKGLNEIEDLARRRLEG